MNTFKRRHKLIVGAIALSLVAAACGGDDDGDATTVPAAETTVAADTTEPMDDTDAPDTTEDMTSTTEGSGTSAPMTGDSVAFDELSGELNGSGATFPKVFYDESIAEFASIASDVTVNYAGGGSGKGRTDLQEQVVDFAGTDGVVKEEDKAGYKGGEFVYIPTVVAPITVSYNLSGLDELQLTPVAIAKIFQGQITTWNDPEIAASNEGVELPGDPISVARRADGSGTTENFTKFLNAAAGPEAEGPDAGVWTLGSGSEVEWLSNTLAGDGNSGVAQLVKDTPGAIGYVDLGDADANSLVYAAVQNKAGEFVLPSVEAASAAADGAEINPDLTYFVGWADGAESYPIAAQTWIIAYTTQSDPATAETLRGFLTYLLTDAQELAPELGFAPLPESLQEQALANVAKIGA